ncbi:hypothetical protein HNR60_000487 [Rhodopseudomonas rhenobacensis]|uniref:Uncharacterized protein n=1 Tax=Rhodopseudomonas rhenobacensis TaxID=87461 RepID=A0A7W8DXI0_9BRAD|nr:hypothetical protein [Rhodopseudomonas rhenobacensis]MBB5045752.1 hypothetical protein [Rhodopseudomonas rhenobacensis]
MKQLLALPIILLLVLTADRAAATESFSVRCEGGVPARPYFVTFDIDAKAVVFETPPLDLETYSDANVYPGDISSVGHGAGEKIEFIVRGLPGRIDLIFDRDQKTMTWPGLEDFTFRPTLVHRCTITPPRSILSFRVHDPILHPISVRCEDTAGYMYFTMDAASKQVLFDRGKEGRLYQGEVTDVSHDEITLAMNFEGLRRVVWSKNRRTITIDGMEGDRDRPRTVMQCQDVAPRTMMIYHGRLQR